MRVKEAAAMRRTILLAAILPFVSAFLGGALAFGLLVPSLVTAQVTQPQEVRAARFVLVAADGTVLANLEPGGDGNGRLQLYDKTGTLRVGLAGGGALNIADPDGVTQRFRAGYVPYEDSARRPPINGMWLDADGSISLVPASR
jgi:hypothetical protein